MTLITRQDNTSGGGLPVPNGHTEHLDLASSTETGALTIEAMILASPGGAPDKAALEEGVLEGDTLEEAAQEGGAVEGGTLDPDFRGAVQRGDESDQEVGTDAVRRLAGESVVAPGLGRAEGPVDKILIAATAAVLVDDQQEVTNVAAPIPPSRPQLVKLQAILRKAVSGDLPSPHEGSFHSGRPIFHLEFQVFMGLLFIMTHRCGLRAIMCIKTACTDHTSLIHLNISSQAHTVGDPAGASPCHVMAWLRRHGGIPGEGSQVGFGLVSADSSPMRHGINF